MDEMI